MSPEEIPSPSTEEKAEYEFKAWLQLELIGRMADTEAKDRREVFAWITQTDNAKVFDETYESMHKAGVLNRHSDRNTIEKFISLCMQSMTPVG